MSLLITLFIGGLAGLLAGLIYRGHGFGFLSNIVIGVVGSFIGSFVFGLMGIQDTNFLGTIVVSTIGSVILLFVLNLLGVKKAN